MYFLGVLVLMLGHFSQGFPVPVDTIIVQVQQWVSVDAQQVVEQVLLNGVSVTGTSQEVNNIIKTISADSLPLTLLSVNQTAVLINHIVLRSRECILEGSELHWTDRVLYDGQVCLTLDNQDAWTAHTPQAMAIKELWDQAVQHTKTERIQLQEGCTNLMRELRLSDEQSVSGFVVPQFLILFLALLAFTGFILISVHLSKKHSLRHPGGVLGSVIHYPKNMAEMETEIDGCAYRTL